MECYNTKVEEGNVGFSYGKSPRLGSPFYLARREYDQGRNGSHTSGI